MIRVLFVCHGNICRSTLAESVFTHKVKQLGFAERELLIEFGYPTQRFVLPPKYMEDIQE